MTCQEKEQKRIAQIKLDIKTLSDIGNREGNGEFLLKCRDALKFHYGDGDYNEFSEEAKKAYKIASEKLRKKYLMALAAVTSDLTF